MHVEVTLRPGHRQAAGCVGMEIRQIPSLEEIPKALDARVLLERSQRGDTQLTRVGQFHGCLCPVLLTFGLDSFLSCPDQSLAMMQAQERIGAAMFLPLAALLQQLRFDEGTTTLIKGNRKLVGNWPFIARFPIVNLEPYRLLGALASQALEPAPLLHVARRLDVGGQTIRHKPERIEQGAFAHPILTDNDREGCKRLTLPSGNPPQRHVSQGAIVLYTKAFNDGHPLSP